MQLRNGGAVPPASKDASRTIASRLPIILRWSTIAMSPRYHMSSTSWRAVSSRWLTTYSSEPDRRIASPTIARGRSSPPASSAPISSRASLRCFARAVKTESSCCSGIQPPHVTCDIFRRQVFADRPADHCRGTVWAGAHRHNAGVNEDDPGARAHGEQARAAACGFSPPYRVVSRPPPDGRQADERGPLPDCELRPRGLVRGGDPAGLIDHQQDLPERVEE